MTSGILSARAGEARHNPRRVTDTMYVLLSQEFHRRRHTNRLSQPLSARETFNHVPLAGGWMVAQNPTVLSLFLCLWNSLYNLDS